MLSRGFYSFYVFALLVFIGMGVWGFYVWQGRGSHLEVQEHLTRQLKIYSKNLADLGKACLRQYGLESCRSLHFDLEGYQANFSITSCVQKTCIIDVSIEVISPLTSQVMRHTQRAIWDLKNLK